MSEAFDKHRPLKRVSGNGLTKDSGRSERFSVMLMNRPQAEGNVAGLDFRKKFTGFFTGGLIS